MKIVAIFFINIVVWSQIIMKKNVLFTERKQIFLHYNINELGINAMIILALFPIFIKLHDFQLALKL